MKILLALFLSSIFANLVVLATHGILFLFELDMRAGGYIILCNICFVLCLISIVCYDRKITLKETSVPLFILIFMVLNLVITIVAGFIGQYSLTIATLVMMFAGAVGYYPSGIDVPLGYGVPIWFISAFGAIALGLGLGMGARSLRDRFSGNLHVSRRQPEDS